jgi:D-arabinose 1-dehydrogenase-like Zn-dependent alcohol dehydrogenase
VGQLTGEFVPFNPAQLFLKGISMLSATSTTREELRLSLQMLRQGYIRTMFGPRFPLSRANQALALVQSGAVAGRVLLVPGS